MLIRCQHAGFWLSCMLLVTVGCSKHKHGTIRLDGSSTVFLISEAVSEEYQRDYPVRISIGASGTGGGFKRFCAGQVGIIGASRAIKEAEHKACEASHIQYQELPVAYDGIVIVVNPHNTWIDELTLDELKRMWEPSAQNKITSWKQIRAQWPDEPLHLFGPGVDSGTYDYFTEAVVGKSHASRGDVTSSEDDNVLVQGVATDVNALGFFGYAYYSENQDKVKAIPIQDPRSKKPLFVMPTPKSIADGSYHPLSRQLFLYVSNKIIPDDVIEKFVDFYIHASDVVADVGYIPLPKAITQKTGLLFKQFMHGAT